MASYTDTQNVSGLLLPWNFFLACKSSSNDFQQTLGQMSKKSHGEGSLELSFRNKKHCSSPSYGVAALSY